MNSKRIALIGLPFDHNSSYLAGAALAPPEIRKAFRSDSSNLWTESGIDLSAPDCLHDAGDLSSYEKIPEAISQLLEQNHAVVSLGGDHSVTFPVMKAFRSRFPKLNILHFDAHPDLYHDFEGNPNSHASPFARIMENRLADRLVQLGIRTLNRHQEEQAKRFGVEMVEMKNWHDDLKFEFDGPVYISIDVDALDPAFAPGVSHYEPGGLSTRQIVRVIQSLKAPVVGADIVELNPTRDIHGITAMVCAKLLKEILGKMMKVE